MGVGGEPVVEFDQLVGSALQLVEAFAVERGHTLAELAFSWLASQPVVGSIIAGATKPKQLKVNAAAPAWSLSAQKARTDADYDAYAVFTEARAPGWRPKRTRQGRERR